MHKEYKSNDSKVNVSNKETIIRPAGEEYEHTSHIDVSLKEEIRKTVINILKEMTEQRYNEKENLYSDEETEDEE